MPLQTEEDFRDRIVAHLLEHVSDSISGIARALSKDRDRPIHRLTVAGYLQAMTEMGFLREVPRPPSKAYQLASPHAHRSLYERVGQATRDIPMPSEQRAFVALAALNQTLGRPVFRAELAATRLNLPDDLPVAAVDPDRRERIRDRIHSKRWPKLQVPRHDPLLEGPQRTQAVQAVCKALLSATDSDHLVLQERRATQLHLHDVPEADG